MAGRDEITTYEQLRAMTPQQRHEHFLASTVLDPADWQPNERAPVQRLDELTLAREERLRVHRPGDPTRRPRHPRPVPPARRATPPRALT